MPPVSRRDFLSGLSATAAVTTAVSSAGATPPPRAWMIMAVGWEYNDEFSYEEGEFPHPQLFYDQAAAQAECQRLCHEFFTTLYPAPSDFEPDWSNYDLDRGPDFDETAVTWEELRQAGFPDPYYVYELTVPGAITDE